MSERSAAQASGVETTSDRYLAFSLSGEQFAIPLLQVKEVIGMTPPTPVPYMPAHFRGIINLRGKIISIIDLRQKLRMPKAEVQRQTSIIILDMDPLCLGVVVDSINSVMALPANEISPPPDAAIAQEQCLLGVARKDGKLTLLLDIEATLSVEDLKALKSTPGDRGQNVA